jgi:AraC-like DNA-binding protein
LISNFHIPEAPHLKDVIHSIWQIERGASFRKEYIIPKGVVEIIFNFSSTIPAQLNGKEYHLSKAFINGFNTAPIELRLPDQQVFFGVQLQPLAVKKILGAPACEFSDIPVDVTLLDSTFNSLWHRLAEQRDFKSRVDVVCSWIEKKLPGLHPQEKLLNDFLCVINQHDLSVKELASSLCYSPRHLSRKILEATGINTEEILLFKKYLHAVHLIHHSNLSLTEIAYQSLFSDQSHFIKSFKAYAKMTPGDYKRQKSHLKGHIFENVR